MDKRAVFLNLGNVVAVWGLVLTVGAGGEHCCCPHCKLLPGKTQQTHGCHSPDPRLPQSRPTAATSRPTAAAVQTRGCYIQTRGCHSPDPQLLHPDPWLPRPRPTTATVQTHGWLNKPTAEPGELQVLNTPVIRPLDPRLAKSRPVAS